MKEDREEKNRETYYTSKKCLGNLLLISIRWFNISQTFNDLMLPNNVANNVQSSKEK